MNKAQKKELAEALAKLEEAREILDQLFSQEEEKIQNTPDNLQNSERFQTMEEHAAKLEEARDGLDGFIYDLQEITEQ